MGQLTSAANATGMRAESDRNDDGVLLVKPEGEQKRPLPPYELRAEELYRSYVRPFQIVPPLLRTSAGLSPSSSEAEQTLLNSLHRRWNSLVVSQVRLMEREALQLQKAGDAGDEGHAVAATDGKGVLAHGLQEFANSWHALATSAVNQANAEAHAIDKTLAEVNITLDSVKGVADEQNHVAELYNFVEDETHAFLEEVTLAARLLQDDVVAQLRDTWSLMSDAERADFQADPNKL
ncbi:putative helicase-like protein [Trypanosoma rangeli]|uniref:Putative helicase-like protein n=1 Tax=Trypanosoma rangeli TaxID=5698 RepID=A0A3R7KPP1_TRYRA|nr:putative helicase-like protein [Trypanosoma rangeli]RNF11105.1 putative helicase-like protein [Trypanosoma rangeli]|eukprot:RNF11105.1 putative helicase-like protein [Trypanosoma rangeli]